MDKLNLQWEGTRKDRAEKIIRREGAGGDRSICAVGDYVNCAQKNRGSKEIPEEDQTYSMRYVKVLLSASTKPHPKNVEPKIGMIQGTLGNDVVPSNSRPRGARRAPYIPGTRRTSGGAVPP